MGHWLEGKVIRRGGPRVRAASALGNHSVAVILVNFATDSNPEPWTPAQVRGRIFDDSDSTAAFYNEESYGDITLSGDVFGWYRIDGPADTCDYSLWASQAIDAAQADGHDLRGYGHVQFVFPYQSSCGWAGLGYMPGQWTWLNGAIDPWVAAHELGHNMGLHHASSYHCTSGAETVTWSSNCTASEYGDPYDVMGSGTFHNNSLHLAQLGILPSSNVKTIAASGTYTIKSALTRGAGINLLRVPTGGSPARYYDLSIRESGVVFDSLLPASMTSGVSMHWDPSTTLYPPMQSLLLDGTPNTADDFSDAALPVGSTFSDGENAITVDSVVPGQATVSVVLANPHDTAAPSAPDDFTATAVQGGADLSWSASTDNVGVVGYRIVRDGAIVGTTTSLTWPDSNLAPGSTHSYRVQAMDAAGNGTPSTLRWITVPAVPDHAGGDVTAPAVTLLKPRSRARLRGRAVIAAGARDAGGVARIDLYIDGRRVRVARSSSLRWTWVLRRVRAGAHTIRVRAVDASGNAASRSVRVRVLRRG